MNIQQTAGRWWSPEGFRDGICHHDHMVQQITNDDSQITGPLFLPAPVDLHVHGGGGHDCMDGEHAIRGTLATHAQHGTGAMLATSVTAPFIDIDQFIDAAQAVMQSPDEGSATLLGVHLEGPFISEHKLGAQPPFATPVNMEQLQTWFDSGIVRVITYAPELDPDGDMLALCKQYGVRAQLGHTICSWAQAQQALLQGAGVTHLYNAMSPVAHRDGGAATAALAYAEYAEIILDGYHVERAAFDAARRAIPGLYSVTDATAASGMPDGNYTLGSLNVCKSGNKVLLPDGSLAGSCLTQEKVIAVLREWESGWHAIGTLLSAVPARWAGCDNLGQIAPGASAHWLEIDHEQPVALWLNGERQPLKSAEQ